MPPRSSECFDSTDVPSSWFHDQDDNKQRNADCTSGCGCTAHKRQDRQRRVAKPTLLDRVVRELQGLQRKSKNSRNAGPALFAFPPACLEMVQSLPGNDRCIDCNMHCPDWATVTYGGLICMSCCGHHRGLGVQVSLDNCRVSVCVCVCVCLCAFHKTISLLSSVGPFHHFTHGHNRYMYITLHSILYTIVISSHLRQYSKVRSLKMDHWSVEQIMMMLEGGNKQLGDFFGRHKMTDQNDGKNMNGAVPPIIRKRYYTKAALFYRNGMKTHVHTILDKGSYQGRDASRQHHD